MIGMSFIPDHDGKQEGLRVAAVYFTGVTAMTLGEALAICLHLQDVETVGEQEERALDAAREIVDREARKAISIFLAQPRANPSTRQD